MADELDLNISKGIGKCAASSSDGSNYVELNSVIIKDDDEFQSLLKSLAPKEFDMSVFSDILNLDGPNLAMFNDAITKSLQTFAPLLQEIKWDADNFISDEPDFGSHHNHDEFESLLAYLAPDDFNFQAIMQHMVNCSKHHKRAKADNLEDIRDMVFIGLNRGDFRKDQLGTTGCGGAKRIVELVYWYKIPLRSAPGEIVRLQTDTLTFVRAIKCFLHLASFVLCKEGFAKNGAKYVLGSERLPDAMKHCGFCGLIPKCSDTYLLKAYVFAHAAYMVYLGILINPDDKRSLKEMAVSQVEYSKAAVGKLPYDDEFLVGIFRAVGLTDSGVFKKIVDVCNNLCKVVGEPELAYETAVKDHIKNNKVCFFEDENKDVAAGEQSKYLADKMREARFHDFSTSMN